jgi:hypothetical protein
MTQFPGAATYSDRVRQPEHAPRAPATGHESHREPNGPMADDYTEDELGWLNRQQGFFGEQLVATLAAAGGLSVSSPQLDLGFDVNLESPDGEIARLQIKNTRQPLARTEESLRYELEVEAYNRLRRAYVFPTFLVVVEVPEHRHKWATCTDDTFALRRRTHFTSLRDEPESANKATVTVSLPLANMVTPEVLRTMVEGGLQ